MTTSIGTASTVPHAPQSQVHSSTPRNTTTTCVTDEHGYHNRDQQLVTVRRNITTASAVSIQTPGATARLTSVVLTISRDPLRCDGDLIRDVFHVVCLSSQTQGFVFFCLRSNSAGKCHDGVARVHIDLEAADL